MRYALVLKVSFEALALTVKVLVLTLRIDTFRVETVTVDLRVEALKTSLHFNRNLAIISLIAGIVFLSDEVPADSIHSAAS